MPTMKEYDEFNDLQQEIIRGLIPQDVLEQQFRMTLNILRVTVFILRSKAYSDVFLKQLIEKTSTTVDLFAVLSDVCKRYSDTPDLIIPVMMRALTAGHTAQNEALKLAIQELEIA